MSKSPTKKRWTKKRVLRVVWTIICIVMLLSMLVFTVLPGLTSVSSAAN